MQEQYKKFIINKVKCSLYNFNITWREQSSYENNLNWETISEYYPFYNQKFHEWQDIAGKEGYYVKIINSVEDKDSELKLHDASNAKRVHVFPFGFPGKKRRSYSRTYYPRCSKAIATGVANMPFSITIGEAIAKMSPRGDEYFRVALGYGPFNTESITWNKFKIYSA